jgi:DNA-directed RNA polymerase specialized sigma24 family protein
MKKSKVSTTQYASLSAAKEDARNTLRLGNGKLSHDAPSVPLKLLYQGRIFPLVGKDSGQRETPLTQEERKARIEHDKMHPYKDSGKKTKDGKGNYRPTGQATCEALFTRGEKLTDGFSRTIALRYLSKRMVFTRGKAKGQEDAPSTLRQAKTSSSRHANAFYMASDVEDMVQEAFLIFSGHGTTRKGKPLNFLVTGNRFFDTCNACRAAMNLESGKRNAERKKLDVLAAKIYVRQIRERSKENKFYDEELEQLLDAARIHGITQQNEIALTLGIAPSEVNRRIMKLRARVQR